MSEPHRILTPPVHLPDPYGDPPKPNPECLDCRAWVKVRDDARARNDYAASAAAAEELRLHVARCTRKRERAERP